jgi:hypothetical protein
MKPSNESIMKASLINSLINGGINAAISWFTFSKHNIIPITLDHISNHEVTVLGQGVLLALLLSLILTGVNFAVFSKELRKANDGQRFRHPFWPWGVQLAVRNSLTAFGVAMVVAVLWQRFIGTVLVPPAAATIIMFFVAGGLVFYVSMATMKTMLHAQNAG